jgi:hypothetical protein
VLQLVIALTVAYLVVTEVAKRIFFRLNPVAARPGAS